MHMVMQRLQLPKSHDEVNDSLTTVHCRLIGIPRTIIVELPRERRVRSGEWLERLFRNKGHSELVNTCISLIHIPTHISKSPYAPTRCLTEISIMTSLSTKLAVREASGRPIQIGLIGAGKFGSML